MMGSVLQNLKPPSYQTHSRGLSDSEGPLVDHSSKKGKAITVPITTLKGRLPAGSLEGVVTRNMASAAPIKHQAVVGNLLPLPLIMLIYCWNVRGFNSPLK
jgi:hypothetical protein